jgi:deoxyribodipyrimidine photo-lyase
MTITIVWFKKDLRLRDHAPLCAALETGLPVLLVFFFEPSVKAYPDWHERHWQFQRESIEDMNAELAAHAAKIHVFHAEVRETFEQLTETFHIQSVFSHEEIGNALTFARDKAMKKFFRAKGVMWNESPMSGVIRGLKSREGWDEYQNRVLTADMQTPTLNKLRAITLDENVYHTLGSTGFNTRPDSAETNLVQRGGTSQAKKYLESFIEERAAMYLPNISKPLASRRSCSRLSPYLAYGNLSSRQVFQAVEAGKSYVLRKIQHQLTQFQSRLMWRDHFIQKFESESRLETENLNRGYDQLKKPHNESLYRAWTAGETGFPIVDASMRCLKATGWINFRMRAMLVSFITQLCWQDWREPSRFLAQQFLDYEPGIHYPQFQMQTGIIGIHTIRIYNPVKQSLDNDPNGAFIKQWIPELARLPLDVLHKPWTMSAMEEDFFHCKLGTDYPLPVIEHERAYQHASDVLWKMKTKPAVVEESARILSRHVRMKPSTEIENENE